MAQEGGAVAQRALARQIGRGGFKDRDLVGDTARAVGVGKVRHQRNLFHLRQRIEPGPGGAEGGGCEAQAVHAAVELEEDPLRQLGLVRGEPVDLFGAVHCVPQMQARAELEVARLEHAFKQQDRAAPVQRAQALRLGQVQQREAVGTAQRVEHALDAVAVGVGLDHRPDARVGRPHTGLVQVVLERCGMDGGVDGAGHGGSAMELVRQGAVAASGAML